MSDQDVGERAVRLMERLQAGLTERRVPNDGPDYADAVTRALTHIDRLDTALNEVARDQLTDEGFQELRLGVLPVAADIAARAVDHAEQPLLVRDVEQVTVGVAERLAGWVATGRYHWMAEDPRVSAEERSDDTKDSSKITEVG